MDRGIPPDPAFKDFKDKMLWFICECKVRGINKNKAVAFLQWKWNINPVWSSAVWEKITSQQNRNAAAANAASSSSSPSPSPSPSLQQQQQNPPRFTNPPPYIPRRRLRFGAAASPSLQRQPPPAPRFTNPLPYIPPAPRPQRTQGRRLRSDAGASSSRHQPRPRLHDNALLPLQFGDTATPSFSSAMQGAMRPHQQNIDDNALFQQPAAYLPDLNLPASSASAMQGSMSNVNNIPHQQNIDDNALFQQPAAYLPDLNLPASASAMQQYEQPPQNVEGQASPSDDCIDWLFCQPLLDDETLDLLSAFLWDEDGVGTSISASAPMQQSNPNAAVTPPIPNQQSDPNAAETPPIPNQQSDPNAAETPPIPNQQPPAQP